MHVCVSQMIDDPCEAYLEAVAYKRGQMKANPQSNQGLPQRLAAVVRPRVPT
jgi:hypothetical protein